MGDALATVSADRNALAELEDSCLRRKNGWRPAPPSPPQRLCRTSIIRMDLDLQQTAIIIRSMPEMAASFRVCRAERPADARNGRRHCRFPQRICREAASRAANQESWMDVIR